MIVSLLVKQTVYASDRIKGDEPFETTPADFQINRSIADHTLVPHPRSQGPVYIKRNQENAIDDATIYIKIDKEPLIAAVRQDVESLDLFEDVGFLWHERERYCRLGLYYQAVNPNADLQQFLNGPDAASAALRERLRESGYTGYTPEYDFVLHVWCLPSIEGMCAAALYNDEGRLIKELDSGRLVKKLGYWADMGSGSIGQTLLTWKNEYYSSGDFLKSDGHDWSITEGQGKCRFKIDGIGNRTEKSFYLRLGPTL